MNEAYCMVLKMRERGRGRERVCDTTKILLRLDSVKFLLYMKKPHDFITNYLDSKPSHTAICNMEGNFFPFRF